MAHVWVLSREERALSGESEMVCYAAYSDVEAGKRAVQLIAPDVAWDTNTRAERAWDAREEWWCWVDGRTFVLTRVPLDPPRVPCY